MNSHAKLGKQIKVPRVVAHGERMARMREYSYGNKIFG